jgi:hypothetical protein
VFAEVWAFDCRIEAKKLLQAQRRGEVPLLRNENKYSGINLKKTLRVPHREPRLPRAVYGPYACYNGTVSTDVLMLW